MLALDAGIEADRVLCDNDATVTDNFNDSEPLKIVIIIRMDVEDGFPRLSRWYFRLPRKKLRELL